MYILSYICKRKKQIQLRTSNDKHMERKDRIVALINALGMQPTQFAGVVGLQSATLSHIINGRNNASLDVMEKILLQFPQVSADWLILGQGEMMRSHTEPDLFSTMAVEVDRSVPPVDEKKVRRAAAKTELPKPKTEERRVSKVILMYTDNSFEEFQPM